MNHRQRTEAGMGAGQLRSERRSLMLISRLRHCAEGRARKCQIQARTSRFTIAPAAASASMGMRIAS